MAADGADGKSPAAASLLNLLKSVSETDFSRRLYHTWAVPSIPLQPSNAFLQGEPARLKKPADFAAFRCSYLKTCYAELLLRCAF